MMTHEQAAFLREFTLQGVEGELKTTARVLGAIPDSNQNYRPDANSRTAIELAKHIAQSDVWFLDALAASNFEITPPVLDDLKTFADVATWYEKNIPAGIAKVRQMSPESLTKVLPFFGVFNFPAVVYLAFLRNHSVHHRGQLSAYIRAAGGKVPDIYGGSFDEPFQQAASA